jgi:hypothetical protein
MEVRNLRARRPSLLQRLVSQIATNVSEEPSASILSVELIFAVFALLTIFVNALLWYPTSVPKNLSV